MKFFGNTGEFLELDTLNEGSHETLKAPQTNSLGVLWFTEGNSEFLIDGKPYTFQQNDLLFVTEFHQIEVLKIHSIRFVRFNRPFYCVIDYSETGCKGALFFGASQVPRIHLPEDELEKFEILWRMFSIEMESNDQLQIEMLQMMLKRYLILSMRLYTKQHMFAKNEQELEIVREFNFLIEQHFRKKHTVAEYSDLLHRSPKTLSNLFARAGLKTPIQYIHDRILLEARRMLIYSDKTVKEIAFELGYMDIPSFSRFFKNHEGLPPSEFKEKVIGEKLITLRE